MPWWYLLSSGLIPTALHRGAGRGLTLSEGTGWYPSMWTCSSIFLFFFFFSFIEFTDSSFAYNIQCSSHHMPSFMPITQPLCPQALPSSNPVGFPQLKVSYGLSPSLISSYLYSAFLTPWFFLVVLRNGCSVCPTFIYSSFWAALMSLGRIVQPRLLGKEIAFHEMYAI